MTAAARGFMGFTVVPRVAKSLFELRSMAVPNMAMAKTKYDI